MIGKVGRDMSQMGAASMKHLGWACCTRGPVPVLYYSIILALPKLWHILNVSNICGRKNPS